jgi:prepilin-type N-terminal cleavage/methylation domain-containing protein
MTISSAKFRRPARAGFTLVEVLMCASIGSFVMLGLLTCFGMIARTGTSLYNYVDMEDQARRGLEKFSEDSRMAKAIDWTSSTSVTLTIPHVATDIYSDSVTYWWDATTDTTSPTYQCFLRREVDTNAAGSTTTTTTSTLIKHVQSFQFDRWQAGGATGVQATTNANTDQLQIHLTLRKQGSERGSTSTAIVAATNLVVSARYILRNKH